VSLALDAVCAFGLVVTRPEGVWPGRSMLKYDLVSVCGLVFVVGLLFAATGETAGRALCRFRGEPLFIAWWLHECRDRSKRRIPHSAGDR